MVNGEEAGDCAGLLDSLVYEKGLGDGGRLASMYTDVTCCSVDFPVLFGFDRLHSTLIFYSGFIIY